MPNLIFYPFFSNQGCICIGQANINKPNQNKSVGIKTLLLGIALLFSLISNKAFAAVSVTAPSAQVYPCPGFPTSYVTLGNIVLTEGSNTDFGGGAAQTNVTLILDVPLNFEFQPGVGSVSFTGSNITSASVSVTATQITVTFSNCFGGACGAVIDALTISGIKVRGITAITASSQITRSGGTAVITGSVVGGLTYGNLTSTSFPSANAGMDQIICATSSTFGASPIFDPNITGLWTLVSGTGTIATPGSPTSTVSGLTLGDNIFKWTISSGGCTSSANITITAMASGIGCTVASNSFSAVTAINNSFAAQSITCPPPSTAPGITQFTLANPGPFNVGDKVLVIQMQGAIVDLTDAAVNIGGKDAVFGKVLNYNGAGSYEYSIIASKVGSVVTFSQNLINAYDVTGKVQLVTVPQFANYTLSTTLTGTPWNSATGTGGVLVFEVFGTLTLNGTISMDYRGFLGGGSTMYPGAPLTPAALNFGVYNPSGTASAGFGIYTSATGIPSTGYRGEGIAASSSHIFGRGALANGGGSGAGWNSGAGGGSNICAGGQGGYEYSSVYTNCGSPYDNGCVPVYSGANSSLVVPAGASARVNGVGGYALNASGPRVFMGGGGGAGNGDGNDATAGGNGGGIIIITAGTIAGTSGTITSLGQAGYDNNTATYPGTVDATGAGGAGGSVILDVGSYSIGTLNVKVNGGKGGDNNQDATCHGNGGGGGGGLVRFKGAITPNVVISALGGGIGLQCPTKVNGNCFSSTFGALPGGSCGSAGLSAVQPIPQKGCCSVADLGPDQTICGLASITLLNGTASNTNKTFKWYKNGIFTGVTSATYTATSSGAYSVVVDSTAGGFTYCSVTDAMIISNSFPTPYLGPNQQLCSPAYLDLSPTNLATFPASTTWSWKKNGVTIAGETTGYLNNVTAAGTYTVTATSPSAGCGPTSGSITLTTILPVVVNGCTGTVGGTVNLSVSGGNGGTYDWYANSTGGSILTTGTTYSPSISSTTTYWVQDNGLYATTVGPPLVGNTLTTQGNRGNASTDNQVKFDALQDFYLTGMTVQMWANSCGGSFNVVINISKAGYTTQSRTVSVPCGPGLQTYNITFPQIYIPAGSGYQIDPVGSAQALGWWGAGMAYPTSYIGVLKLNNDVGTPGSYPPFFDWKIKYAQTCGRVPVVATLGGACTLPVHLLKYKGSSNEGSVLLEWTTASEESNNHFIISRSSDGINFVPIGTVAGNNTKTSVSNYSYTDNDGVSGLLYYKLTQVDINGSATEVGLVTLFNDKGFTAQVSPNPFSSKLNVNVIAKNKDKVFIRVTDLTGKTVGVYDNLFANEKIEIGEDLPSGLYILEVRTDYEVKTFRIVKVNE